MRGGRGRGRRVRWGGFKGSCVCSFEMTAFRPGVARMGLGLLLSGDVSPDADRHTRRTQLTVPTWASGVFMFSKSYLSCTARLSACVLPVVAMGLAGCAGTPVASVPANAVAVSGNWQVSSVAAAASRLPSLSGKLAGSSAAMTGIFHANTEGACVSSSQSFEVSGAADANNMVTLTAQALPAAS